MSPIICTGIFSPPVFLRTRRALKRKEITIWLCCPVCEAEIETLARPISERTRACEVNSLTQVLPGGAGSSLNSQKPPAQHAELTPMGSVGLWLSFEVSRTISNNLYIQPASHFNELLATLSLQSLFLENRRLLCRKLGRMHPVHVLSCRLRF